jgi:hypothetical protein
MINKSRILPPQNVSEGRECATQQFLCAVVKIVENSTKRLCVPARCG